MTITNLEQVAEYLINEGLHVTALELNSELLRNQGRELSTVRRYFTSNSSPASTRASISQATASSSSGPIRITQQNRASTPIVKKSPSVQTFDSLDLARESDDGAIDQNTEKIAVIEYELRKANETIASLRASLTEAISSNQSKHRQTGHDKGKSGHRPIDSEDDDDSIKPHERKTIAFLIHDFLLSQSFKMTAITLSEEISDQNFNSWFDVGLDTPKPPSLLELLRAQSRSETSSHCHCNESNHCSDKSINNVSSLSSRVVEAGSPLMKDKVSQYTQTDSPASITNEERFTNTSQPSSLTPVQMEDKSCQTDRLLSFLRRSDDDDTSSAMNNSTNATADDSDSAELLPSVFRSTLISEANLMVESELTFQLMATERELIALLAHDLPIIASHITCNENRADLLPLIVSTAALIPRQSDPHVSDKLLFTFFDLIPSPNVLHRKLIVSALVTLAHVYTQKRVQEEILPIIWEQLSNRSPERKILIVDSCIQLLPLVCSSIRASLILSILSVLLNEEKDPHVREAALKALAYLITVLAEDESTSEKWDAVLKQILQPCLIETETTSISHDASLKRCFNRYFMPAFAYWSLKIKKLSHLVNVLVTCTINHHRSQIAIGSLEICVPFVFLNLVMTTPTLKNVAPSSSSSSTASDDKGHRFCFINNKLLNLQVIAGSSVSDMIGHFDQLLARDWFKPWHEWDEFDRKILPSLLSTLIPNCNASQLPHLLNLCSSLGQHLGLSVLRLKVKPILLRAMYQEMNEASNQQMSSSIATDGKEVADNQENQSVQMLLPSFAAVLISVKPIQEEEKRDLSTCLSKCLLLGQTKAVLDAVGFIVGESHSEVTRNDLNSVIIDFLRQSIGHSESVDVSIIKILDCFISENSRVALSREATVSLVDDALSIIDQIDVTTASSDTSSPADGNSKHDHCISCYASLVILILSNSQCESLLQSVYSKLDLLLEGGHIESHINLVQLLARVARSSSQHIMKEQSHVFLDYSLPRLAAITVQCRSSTSNKKKQELILALLDCYTKFSFLDANDQLVRESVLPSLRLAKAEVASIAPEYDETVVALIHEFERKLNETVINSTVTSSVPCTSSARNSNQSNRESQASVSGGGNIPPVPSTCSVATATSISFAGPTNNSGAVGNKHPSNPDLRARFKGFFNKKL